MKPAARLRTVEVTADGEGLVSHAGVALVVELADRSGLTDALSAALADTRERRSAHDPGRVIRDVAVMLVDGGDCVTDMAAFEGQERLFGARASETTTHRVLKSVDESSLARVRSARAQARARVWDAGARPDTITLHIDATLLTAHSDKELAAGNYKHGYGFHPLGCWLDETGEALAAILRPGNAGSNTAEDHFTVLGMALTQLPAEDLDREILVRTDIGGCTHAFTNDCREAGIRFSVGYELTETVRQAILELPESAWVQAIDADGKDRKGAWVAELTDYLDLSAWPEGSRLIARRERPHPGAQFTIFDEHGHRYTCFLTDQDGNDIATLELHHRGRARVEDSIRAGKDTGMRNLPHYAFEHNQTWLEISLIAQDLLAWTRLICLDGELAKAEPKRLRQRLLHIAAKLSATAGAPGSSSTATGPGPRRSPPGSRACAPTPRSAEHRPHPEPDSLDDHDATPTGGRLPANDSPACHHDTPDVPAGPVRVNSRSAPRTHTPKTKPQSPLTR